MRKFRDGFGKISTAAIARRVFACGAIVRGEIRYRYIVGSARYHVRADTVARMDLNDAQKMADEYSTFHAPDPLQLQQIVAGYLVKVSNLSERFWVLVTSVDGQRIRGTIDNHLAPGGPTLGDAIELELRHVYEFKAPELN